MDNFEERFKKIEERLGQLEKTFQAKPVAPAIPKKKISVKEFLIEKKPKSEVETTFYLGYFLEKMEAKESFGREDLINAYRMAKIPLPKNISDTINKNIFKGYFMEVKSKEKEKKRWEITATGETSVEKGQ